MMDQELYKVCPECAGEYRPEIELCADCGVPLVHPEEIAFRNARELPLAGGLVALRTAPIAWVRALAQDLAAQAIPYGIDRRAARSDGILKLYVRRQDQVAAEALDAARERIEGPLYPEEEGAIEEAANVVPFREEPADYKVCPRCGGEYRLDAEHCVDCEVELVAPEDALAESALRDVPEVEADGDLPFTGPRLLLPPSDEIVCVCCRLDRFLWSLSRELDAAGIAHRLEPAPHGSTRVGCLYVLPADGDAAAAIDAAFWGTPVEGSDLPEEPTVCPACDAPYLPGALECSNCSLVFGSDPICPRCGTVIGEACATPFGESETCCPNCGETLPEA